jgi:hypothetical protein
MVFVLFLARWITRAVVWRRGRIARAVLMVFVVFVVLVPFVIRSVSVCHIAVASITI